MLTKQQAFDLAQHYEGLASDHDTDAAGVDGQNYKLNIRLRAVAAAERQLSIAMKQLAWTLPEPPPKKGKP